MPVFNHQAQYFSFESLENLNCSFLIVIETSYFGVAIIAAAECYRILYTNLCWRKFVSCANVAFVVAVRADPTHLEPLLTIQMKLMDRHFKPWFLAAG